jgi:large subunit ribosomal protein L9
MEVILKRDVPNVGRIGEIVRVKNGYARNFLLPRSLAVVADKGNVRSLEHHKRLIEKEKAKVKAESEEKATQVKEVKLGLKKRFNEANKMFGSVTATELVDLLKTKGYTFDRRDIEIPDIAAEGTYEVKVRLPGDVYSTVELKIDAIKEKKTKKKAAAKKTKKTEETKKAKAEKAEKEESKEAAEASAEEKTEEAAPAKEEAAAQEESSEESKES